MKKSITFALLLWLPTYIHAECCPKVALTFYKSNKDLSCSEFGATVPYSNAKSVGESVSETTGHLNNGACSIRVCGDGKPPVSGHYCGIGSCNIFGCNCDFGCIAGKPKDEFERIHGDAVNGVVYSDFSDILKYHKKSCCTTLFDDASWKGESIQICNCDEKCINLADEWKDRASSAHVKTSNNLMLYSKADCTGKELKVPGSVGMFSGKYCRRNFGDGSLISGCSTTALNDNSYSIKILHKSAIASLVGVIW